MNVGARVEIERPITHSGLETRTEWVAGTVEGMRAGNAGEDFERIIVRTDDGYLYDACHPKHVRAATPTEIQPEFTAVEVDKLVASTHAAARRANIKKGGDR